MNTSKKSLILMAIFLSTCIIKLGHTTTLPDLPVALKNGTGAVDSNGVIYVGLGTAGKSWYKIDLKSKSKIWESIKQFPDVARDQAVSVFLDGDLYVFGGIGKDNEKSTLRVFSDVYKYSPTQNSWQKVDTVSPIGLAGHAAVNLDGKNAFITGGVNKNIFDKYLFDIERYKNNEQQKNKTIINYFNKPAKDYFFNKTAFIYNAKENSWRNAGVISDTGTAGSALVINDNKLTLINGEIKPGLRTDTVHQMIWQNNKLAGLESSQLPPLTGSKYQEGLAGAFSGYSHGTLLVAGGANFPGAKENYTKGKYYAHEGLKKQWHDEIYGLVNGHWQYLGRMKQPLGYGISINYGDLVYLLGGENSQGQPIPSVTSLALDKGKLTVN